MSYESWRCTWQDSEQAARAAYADNESLRAQLAEVTRERDDYRFEMGVAHVDLFNTEQQLLATQAHAARLAEALSKIPECMWWEDARQIVSVAISTPINLDALHEDRARTLEEAKRRIYSGEFDTLCAEDAIQCIADELRAKKEAV